MRELPVINEPSLDLCRVDFDPQGFRRVLLQHGMPVQWEYGMVCPCKRTQTRHEVVATSDEARADCTACNGTGILYGPPQESIGILQEVKEAAKLSTILGQYSEGDAFLTMPPEHIPDRLDRITLMAGTRVLSETRQRTAAAVEALRYPILRRVFNVGNADESPGSVAAELGVMYARFTNTSGETQVRDLLEGTDFTVTDAGRIDWTIGDDASTAPATGAWYSVRYFARPVFKVVGFPFLRRDTFTQAPGQAVREFAYMPVFVHLTPEFLGHQAQGNDNDPSPNPDPFPTYA